MAHAHDNKHAGWIGVDFDGTLAHYDGWVSAGHCGDPIKPMVERVKGWLAEGREVRIFTARVFPVTRVIHPEYPLEFVTATNKRESDAFDAARAIRAWCQKHLGRVLPITCVKDYAMVELWDDRAVQVRANTGEPVGTSTRGLS